MKACLCSTSMFCKREYQIGLEKYINLNNSCLSKEKKTKVMDMLFNYKEAFSLRNEIGTCPNIEVEIDVTDKSPFFIRPYHIRKEDKAFIDKEMK